MALATASPRHAHARFGPTTQDVITIALSLWTVLGVFIDGWSHINRPELESFFTPAHGVLYSGFAATAGWLAVVALNGRRPGVPPWRWLPVGYGPAALGVALSAAGGVGDLAWHSVFGVEVALDALTSPTHLLLFAGGVLLLSAPARRAWAGDRIAHSLRARLPEFASLALVGAVTAFFVMFASPFIHPGATEPLTTIPENAPGHYAAEVRAMAALSSYLVMSAVVTGVWLFAARRGAVPLGSLAVIAVTVVVLSASLASFENAGGVLGAAVAAVVADAAIAAVDRRRGAHARGRLALAGAIASGTIWGGQFIGLAMSVGVAWPPELWAGAVMLAAGAGAGLGLLASPPQRHAGATPGHPGSPAHNGTRSLTGRAGFP